MANGNGDSISSRMVLAQASRVRKLVEGGDYEKCHVKGKQEVDLFLIDGMTAILKQSRQSSFLALLSGGSMGAVIVGLFELLKIVGKM